MSNDLVSVVIPAYNEEETIEEAVYSALNQTHDSIELFVVDDCSTDQTLQVVSEINDSRLNIISLMENRGGSFARNRGIEASNGEYIALLDADDRWEPEKIKTQLASLKGPENCVAVTCFVEIERQSILLKLVDLLTNPNSKIENIDTVRDQLLSLEYFVHGGSTLLVEKSTIDKIQGFDEDFQRLQDIEFTIRLLEHGQLCTVETPLATLKDTGIPSPESVICSHEQFLSKFHDEMSIIQTKAHYFDLSRAHFRAGRFREGTRYLRESRPTNTKQVLGLVRDVSKGIRRHIATEMR